MTLQQRGKALVYAVRVGLVKAIGLDEALILAGMILATCGLWPLVGRLSLVVPALVLLWIALPPRAPFVMRPDKKRSTREDLT